MIFHVVVNHHKASTFYPELFTGSQIFIYQALYLPSCKYVINRWETLSRQVFLQTHLPKDCFYLSATLPLEMLNLQASVFETCTYHDMVWAENWENWWDQRQLMTEISHCSACEKLVAVAEK